MIKITPLVLEILLHYNNTVEQTFSRSSAHIARIHQFLVGKELLEERRFSPPTGATVGGPPLPPSVSTFTISPRGRAWLAVMLKTPLPTQGWIDASGNLIHRDGHQ